VRRFEAPPVQPGEVPDAQRNLEERHKILKRLEEEERERNMLVPPGQEDQPPVEPRLPRPEDKFDPEDDS
jgi:hypothetical protein